MIELQGKVRKIVKLNGSINVNQSLAPSAKLQAKTATENGEVTPDAGYDGLSKVTVDVEEYDGTVTVE